MRPVSADNVWMFQAHPAAKLLVRKVVCTACSPLASFLEKEGGGGEKDRAQIAWTHLKKMWLYG